MNQIKMPARNEMPHFRIHLEATGNNRHPATRRGKAVPGWSLGVSPAPPGMGGGGSRWPRDTLRGGRSLSPTRAAGEDGPGPAPPPAPGLGPALRDPGRSHGPAAAEAAALAGRGDGRHREGGRHGPGGEGGTRRQRSAGRPPAPAHREGAAAGQRRGDGADSANRTYPGRRRRRSRCRAWAAAAPRDRAEGRPRRSFRARLFRRADNAVPSRGAGLRWRL